MDEDIKNIILVPKNNRVKASIISEINSDARLALKKLMVSKEYHEAILTINEDSTIAVRFTTMSHLLDSMKNNESFKESCKEQGLKLSVFKEPFILEFNNIVVSIYKIKKDENNIL